MYVSFFDLFKIGIGPSSSHTVGPINAANLFVKEVLFLPEKIDKINITLYGSLALTGKGHGTDLGIVSGLLGYKPDTVNIADIKSNIENNNKIYIKSVNINFDLEKDLIFNYTLNINANYSNKMLFSAFLANSDTPALTKTYYSVGGGFIVDSSESLKKDTSDKVTYPYNSSKELLEIGDSENISISKIVFKNEQDLENNIKSEDLNRKVLAIWKQMNKTIYNGMQKTGELTGKMKIKRRANSLYKKLIKKDESYDPLDVLDWVNIFAIAVSEENASFGRIVTAPTNGAAGIIPAVIKYYIEFTKESNEEGIINFLLTASAIGGLYKNNASISGADAGCQGEVGVACSMAAAGLTSALGGTNKQIENAAEIAMEHNLGLTCDPINGLVQIPCIERNAMGAIKAINASRISLNGSGEHKVSLDEVIKTMWETGRNMSEIYKETSKGGLAVNVSEC